MIPTTLDAQREHVEFLEGVLEDIRDSLEAGNFTMERYFNHASIRRTGYELFRGCRTPACIAGHITSRKRSHPNTTYAAEEATGDLGFSRCRCESLYDILFDEGLDDAIAIRRFSRYVAYHRRRLDYMEIEDNCRWRALPVGRARDLALNH